jgi:hypothetical protein
LGKVEVSISQHTLGEIVHDRFSLHMKVVQHFVGPPMTHKTDDVSVDMGTQQDHGPSSMERVGTDVLRIEI